MYGIKIVTEHGRHTVCVYQMHEGVPIALQSTMYTNTELAPVRQQAETLKQSYAGRLQSLCPNDHLNPLDASRCKVCRAKIV